MAAGYNIPISGSSARAFGFNGEVSAETVFNFSSPDSTNALSPSFTGTVTDPATATSSAAEGNAAAASNGSGVNQPTASAGGSNTLLYVALGIAALFFLKR